MARLRQEHSVVTRISFVAHSLGGLIVRSALTQPILEPIIPKLHTFLTFSSPHLGFLFNPNITTRAGLGVLRHVIKEKTCLRQLVLRDQPNLSECFLYKLSQEKGFSYFKHVVLVSSREDGFVPFHSARVENLLHPSNSKVGKAFEEMVQNLHNEMCNTHIVRLDAHYNSRIGGLSGLLGRVAHILALDSAHFCNLFCSLYWDFFLV
eukprot:c4244_g1_i1.p1 GENE.c4244_g1_i1~~c4244_g1_i1.p1  ORF type:complete len:207 (+),score=26.16 c4244_g1_i1:128-748(+)